MFGAKDTCFDLFGPHQHGISYKHSTTGKSLSLVAVKNFSKEQNRILNSTKKS